MNKLKEAKNLNDFSLQERLNLLDIFENALLIEPSREEEKMIFLGVFAVQNSLKDNERENESIFYCLKQLLVDRSF